MPALLDQDRSGEEAVRVRADLRRTLADAMVDRTLPLWHTWAGRHGMLTRNEAHGSPGNWLDLYALADIPETEMFNRDREPLIAKFASSAAHVAGRSLVSCETGTWLGEHFNVTLADMKGLVDELFVSGVNHVFYHGTCFSPSDAPWPGWLFYASTQMNPRNAFWRDVPALNAYIARCQGWLQQGQPDNDVLLYWPVEDVWRESRDRVHPLTVHHIEWLTDQPVGTVARALWEQGFGFDYVSDRQLQTAKVGSDGELELPGASYRVVVVPSCTTMPLATLQALDTLARQGAAVIFLGEPPADVPGWSRHAERRAAFAQIMQRLLAGQGEYTRVLTGPSPGPLLQQSGVRREQMVDHSGMLWIRRDLADGKLYFVVNQSPRALSTWVELAASGQAVRVLDPVSGASGMAPVRDGHDDVGMQVYLQLAPGESRLLRLFDMSAEGAPWPGEHPGGTPLRLEGSWEVAFIDGAPVIPAPVTVDDLASWTTFGNPAVESFAGTARYRLVFDAPDGDPGSWRLDLGQVHESARIRLNGQSLGIRFAPPYRVRIEALLPVGNVLEVEVTNLSANRIRDLDRQGVSWQNFHDINFVNIDYKPFDASSWPLRDSGLLGPVTLQRMEPAP